MKYSNADWSAKRDRGLVRYLFFDGILITGGPFAVVMQVVGYFFLREENQGFMDYLGSSATWIRFFFHATIFGLIMGYLNWWRNERSFAKPNGEDKA